MTGLRMIAGLATFLLVVFSVLFAASGDFPELAPTGTPSTWPPAFPSFDDYGFNVGAEPSCDVVVLCLNQVVYWLRVFGTIIIGGAAYLFDLLKTVVALLVGFVSWDLPDVLPPEIRWLETVLRTAILAPIALFIFRVVRSAFWFTGSES